MCLMLCLLTKIAKNRSKRSKIALKLLAVCETGLHFRAKSFGLARNHFLSRAKSFWSVRYFQNLARSMKHLRAKLNLWCRISCELETFSRGLKICFARLKTSSRGLERFFAWNLVSAFHFLVCFCCLRPERCLLFNSLLFPICEQSWTNDTLLHWKHDSCTLTKSYLLKYLFALAS